MTDEFYMNLALNEAWKYQILTYPNPAVGCAILDKNGKILSIKAHKKAGFLHAEPLAVLFALFEQSPEILEKFTREYEAKFGVKFLGGASARQDFSAPNLLAALDAADLNAAFCYEFILNNHNGALAGARAFATLEPCAHEGKTPSCAKLLAELKLDSVVIACADENEAASGGAKILKEAGARVETGVCEDAGHTLIEPFNAWRRGNFSFFKIALCANGIATGGIVSNEESRAHMHALRSVVDLLVIGGATVRADRPTLDARLASGGRSPNVLIYSRGQDFDASIPLFSVPGRRVEISDTLDSALKSGLTMIEGGENFLRELDSRVRWVLIYRSSEFKDAPAVRLNLKLKPLFSGRLADGFYAWYKRED